MANFIDKHYELIGWIAVIIFGIVLFYGDPLNIL